MSISQKTNYKTELAELVAVHEAAKLQEDVQSAEDFVAKSLETFRQVAAKGTNGCYIKLPESERVAQLVVDDLMAGGLVINGHSSDFVAPHNDYVRVSWVVVEG